MRKHFPFILICLTLFFACSDDDNNRLNTELKITEVTGIETRFLSGELSETYGNPNVFNDQILVHPNPVDNLLIINSNDILNIWILPAKETTSQQETDFSVNLKSTTFNEETITTNAVLKFEFENQTKTGANTSSDNTLSVNSFSAPFNSSKSIDLKELENGFYKVFVKTESGVYWDNIYKAGDNPLILEFLKNIW